MSPLANAAYRVIRCRADEGLTTQQAIAEVAAREEWTPGQLREVLKLFRDTEQEQK